MGYTSAQAKAFINMIAPLMVAEGRKRGYRIISTAIAQAIIEGAAGTSGLAKYHNHWGLKCGSSWKGKSVNMKTKEEYTQGVLVTIKDNFRVYDSDEEGVRGYYDFISTARYSNLKTAKDYAEYASMLKLDGYATSSTYISTLCSTVKKYDLTKYDLSDVIIPKYKMCKNYVTTSDLYIRDFPDGAKVKFECITENAKAHSFFDEFGNAILKKGTTVTCLGLSVEKNSTWIKIPSGWICAENSSKVFLK